MAGSWVAVLLWWLSFMVGGGAWIAFWHSSKVLASIYFLLKASISIGVAIGIYTIGRLLRGCRSVSLGDDRPKLTLKRRIGRLAVFAAVALVALGGDMIINRYEVARFPERDIQLPVGTGSPARLARHVQKLAGEIGIRNANHPEALQGAIDYINAEFVSAGFQPQSQRYDVPTYGRGGGTAEMVNISVTIPGDTPDAPILVVGAHYDTADGTPGADDNASAVAVLLELAHRLKRTPGRVELHLVAFSTEEPPYFGTKKMGSYHSARTLKDTGRKVIGMISLEMLGYYRDERESQKYPPFLSPFFPDTANFVSVVSDLKSRRFLRRVREAFKPSGNLPVVAAAVPKIISSVGLSDHSSYWKNDIRAVMITDTAFLRNRHYHQMSDLPSHLDYERMANVLDGVEKAVIELRR
ncbi:M28 family peptidase [Elusimicrobiota bacterium]